MGKEKSLQVATGTGGTWVQTDRRAHEEWSKLIIANPRAASVLHCMIAQMGRNNALVTSHETLAKFANCSVATLKRALKVLKNTNWIDVRQIGLSGTVNGYIINDRVAWSGKRNGIRYSLFSATVLTSDVEQPDKEELGALPPLGKVIAMYPDEVQMPTGEGLPPPSQPFLDGLEPDVPAKTIERE